MVDERIKALDEGGEARVDVGEVYDDIKKGLGGPLGIMHAFDGNEAGQIVENYILPCACVINGENVKKGSWMMGVVWEPPILMLSRTALLQGIRWAALVNGLRRLRRGTI